MYSERLMLTSLIINQLVGHAVANTLLLILTDGFAGDYLQWYENSDTFKAIRNKGVWSEHLVPDFPTLSLPNHYSLVTGLHPVNHGIVGNYMYDRDADKYFRCGTESDYDAFWWQKAEPVWMTSTRKGLNTGLYFWPGCQVSFTSDVRPNVCIPHVYSRTSETLSLENVRKIIPTLRSHKFVLTYYNAIDIQGHALGTQRLHREPSSRVNPVNQLFDILKQLMYVADVTEDLNIVVASDHGMISVPDNRARYLDDYIDFNWIRKTVESGAVIQIIPMPGKAEEVYTSLNRTNPIPDTTIYWTTPGKSHLPPHLHYHNSSRVSELVLIANPGFGVFVKSTNNFASNKQFPPATIYDKANGMHGFDNHHPSMHGTFFAYGPAFVKGYHKRTMNLIDIHSMICHVLNLTCPPSDGDFGRIKDILINRASNINIFKLQSFLTIRRHIVSIILVCLLNRQIYFLN